jgi:hypothetical protein
VRYQTKAALRDRREAGVGFAPGAATNANSLEYRERQE